MSMKFLSIQFGNMVLSVVAWPMAKFRHMSLQSHSFITNSDGIRHKQMLSPAACVSLFNKKNIFMFDTYKNAIWT